MKRSPCSARLRWTTHTSGLTCLLLCRVPDIYISVETFIWTDAFMEQKRQTFTVSSFSHVRFAASLFGELNVFGGENNEFEDVTT